ncbi:MAG: sugar phosphate isomerase/epimerase family protein [Elusimicrobiota bacterium]
MRIGRDFTNLLNTTFLSDDEKRKLKEGTLTVADMDAKVQIESKRDIVNQINVAADVLLDHVELDGGIPNPFLQISSSAVLKAKKTAYKKNITLSLHLPYTYICAAVCAFQKEDRELAVGLLKLYIDFAAKLNCINIVMHPGSVPFYQAVGLYRKQVTENLLKSLRDLVPYTYRKGIMFHLENNTAFDSILVDIEECLEILEMIDSRGKTIKFCFDIGHWFTRADAGCQVPNPPENIMNTIPEKYISQVHLNDYIPVVKKFHPPLHYQSGFLKKENLKNLFEVFRKKKVEIVVLETAVREVDELLNTSEIMKKEAEYVKDIMTT